MDRRTFVKGAAAGLGRPARRRLGRAPDLVNLALPSLGPEPRHARTPIEHLVVVMMENRSVDHYLGWYGKENPDFDGIQDASFRDLRQGPTGRWSPPRTGARGGRNDFHGRGFEDPDHGWDGGRLERNGGAVRRLAAPGHRQRRARPQHLRRARPPDLGAADPRLADLRPLVLLAARPHPAQPLLPVLGPVGRASRTTTCRPSSIATTPSGPPAGTGRPSGTCARTAACRRVVLLLEPARDGVLGPPPPHRTRHVAEFFLDLRARARSRRCRSSTRGSPAPSGIANDDHPLADIRLGQAFLSDVVEAFTTSPHYREGRAWSSPTTSGAASGTTSTRPASADDRGTPRRPRRPGRLRAARLPDPVHDHLAVDRGTTTSITRSTSTPRSSSSCPTTGACPTSRSGRASTNSIETAFRGFTRFDPRRRLHALRPRRSTCSSS